MLTNKMPPWFADPRYGHFANERKLSQGEINTLVSWTDAGAPEGDKKKRAAPVEFPRTAGTSSRRKYSPIPQPYHVAAQGVDRVHLLRDSHRLYARYLGL